MVSWNGLVLIWKEKYVNLKIDLKLIQIPFKIERAQIRNFGAISGSKFFILSFLDISR